MVAIELGDGLMRFILGAMKDMQGIRVGGARNAPVLQKRVMLAPFRGGSIRAAAHCGAARIEGRACYNFAPKITCNGLDILHPMVHQSRRPVRPQRKLILHITAACISC
jgi:hypothetical protein